MYLHLETERLLIRPIELIDSSFMLELTNSKGWLEFIGDRNINNLVDAEKYIQNIKSNSSFFYSVFETKKDNKAIGVVTFLHREDEDYPDIGFALLPQHAKKGFAFEASKAYLDQLLLTKPLTNVIAFTKPTNVNSIALLKKLGLVYNGDHKKGKETLSYFSLYT